MIMQAMPSTIRYFGGMPRDKQFVLPERHLGLVQAEEVSDVDTRISAAAATYRFDRLTALPEAVAFAKPGSAALPELLYGVRIAFARDNAFSFIYPANLDVLRAMGATLVFFFTLSRYKSAGC